MTLGLQAKSALSCGSRPGVYFSSVQTHDGSSNNAVQPAAATPGATIRACGHVEIAWSP
ncbi:Hypothetical protein ACGLYG10_1531 [Actinomyces glycerinitolerans]|uniref:Uncharacterized protein n=1 Tax=Actinomyces glycerinitolerans TaxID=1892869 RepID=A0A1M4RZ97_9ACTO|nr:Hypothetical protein ACGLYG10_1531 [Actinomyces glycerinitolerans]